MARLLIVTTKESALSRILAASFDVCRAVAPDDVTAEDLRSCDALALLGGVSAEGISLMPAVRRAVDAAIAAGKPAFAEFVQGVGTVSFLDIRSTRFARPVLVDGTAFGGALPAGTILDEQSNSRLFVYKSAGGGRTILQYVKTPKGFYTVDDLSAVGDNLSERALWIEKGSLMVCSFRMCEFARAKFAPRAAWTAVIRGIAALLGGEAPEEAIRAAFDGAYHYEPGQAPGRAAVRALDWFKNAGMLNMFRGAPYGVREGLAADVYPDGTHRRGEGLRDDCNGEAALAFLIRSLWTGSAEDRAVADGLTRMTLDMQITDEGPHRGMVRGDWHGWWTVSYQDDTARGFLIPLILRSLLTGEDKYIERIRLALDYLLGTTGTDGLRVMRVDFSDPDSDVVEATGMHSTPIEGPDGLRRWHWGGGSGGEMTIGELRSRPGGAPSAHYNGYYMASLLLGYHLTGDRRYFDAGVKGLSAIMSLYPWTAREHSQTQELCRLVLPLAALALVSGAPEHRAWLERVCDDLQAFRHPGGGYIEWDTGYTAVCAGVAGGESSVLCENGNPVMDLLYSLNWLPLGFAMAYFATGEEKYYGLWRDIAAFLSSIQSFSDDPLIDGVWARGFDADLREVYGVPNDVGWAPWAVESGWTVAEIASGLMLGLMKDGAGEKIRKGRGR